MGFRSGLPHSIEIQIGKGGTIQVAETLGQSKAISSAENREAGSERTCFNDFQFKPGTWVETNEIVELEG